MTKEPVIRVFCSIETLDLFQIDQIYRESSLENARSWYPDLPLHEALQKYEQGHHDYLVEHFFSDGGLLMLLESGGHYLCALRLYLQEPERYFIEALETRPDERQKGYAKLLMQEMMLYLHEHCDFCTVRSHVSKRNLASLRTHASVGFHAETDYVMEDGIRDGSRLCLFWDNSQFSRISRFEKIMEHLSDPDARKSIPEEVFRWELSCLVNYYSGHLWRRDYEADEKGMFPQRLKRGVLSQDAIYDLLSEYEELLH